MFRYTRYLTPIGNGVLSGLTHYSHHFRHRPPRKTSRVLRIFDDFRRHSAHFICHAWFVMVILAYICNLHRFCVHVVSAYNRFSWVVFHMRLGSSFGEILMVKSPSAVCCLNNPPWNWWNLMKSLGKSPFCLAKFPIFPSESPQKRSKHRKSL